MSGRKGFLINLLSPGSASNTFDVRGFAVRLTLAGASNGDVAQVQVLVGPNSTEGTWADLAYNGTSARLTIDNSQLVLIVEGVYRVTYSGGSSTLQVWMEEDTIGLDQRSIAVFPTTNNVGRAGADGATGPGYLATSTSLAAITLGPIVLTTQTGLAYTPGARARATSRSSGFWMEGVVSSYSGTSLGITVDKTSGGGPFDDWDINLAGEPGLSSTLPFIDEDADFNIANTSTAYRVTTNAAVTATLPLASTAIGCLYVIEAQGPKNTTVVASGGDLINGFNLPLEVASGYAALLYSNGVDGFSAIYDVVNSSPTVSTPTTGQIISLSQPLYGAVVPTIIKPAGALADLSITFPDGFYGQIIALSFTQTITNLVLPTASATGLPIPTSAAPGDCFLFSFDDAIIGAGNGWMRFK